MTKETTDTNKAGLDISSQEVSRYVREICMENAKCEYDLIETVTSSPPNPANPIYLEVMPRRKNNILETKLLKKEKDTEKNILDKSNEKLKLEIEQDRIRAQYYEIRGRGQNADALETIMDSQQKKINEAQDALNQYNLELNSIRNEMEHPFEVIIRGVEVVLDPKDRNELWGFLDCSRCKLYSGNKWGAIFTKVTIECHKLIVRGALRICTKNLVVRAKHVQWEGDGCLDITPPDYSDRARDAQYTRDFEPNFIGQLGTNGQNGKVGREGGTILFFTDDWIEKGSVKIARLIANGGNGQEPGKGMNGIKREFKGPDGKDVKPVTVYTEKMDNANHPVNFPFPAISYGVRKSVYNTLWKEEVKYGVNAKPPSGSDALSAGIPGSGGKNGSIFTNHPMAAQSAVAEVGKPGPAGEAYTGGDIWTKTRGQQITDSQGRTGYIYCAYSVYVYFYITKEMDKGATQVHKVYEYEVYKGKDAPATYAAPVTASPDRGVILLKYKNKDDKWPKPFRGDKESGQDIELVKKGLNYFPPDMKGALWFSPGGMEKVLDFARTCMLSGHYTQAEGLLLEYYQAFQENGLNVIHEKSSIMLERLVTMLIKIKFGLDYYGNTAGYAPLLSLRGNLERYRGEVDRAIDTLIFTRTIFLDKNKSLDRVATMESMMALMGTEIMETEKRVKIAKSQITEAMRTWGNTSNDLVVINKVRDELLEQTREQAKLKIQITGSLRAAFHAAALVCQFIPKGQPALGSASSGVASVFDVALNPANWDSHSKTTAEVKKAMIEMAESYFKSRDSKTTREKDVAMLLSSKRAELKDTDTMHQMDAEIYETYVEKVSRETKAEEISKIIQGASNEIMALVQALPINEDQIENEFQRLSDSNPQLQRYKLQLELLKEYKKSLMQTIVQKKSAIDYSYMKLNEYHRAKSTFNKKIAFEEMRINPEFLIAAEDLESDALETLRWSLYLLVRAYEASVLQPLKIDLDWDLGNLLKDMTEYMLQDHSDSKDIKKDIVGLYNKNLNKIRNEMFNKLASMIENEIDWMFDFERSQYPDLFAQLDKGSVTFDMLDITEMLFATNTGNLVSEIKLSGIEFEENTGKKLNLWINLNVDREGVVQNDAGRYKIHGDEDYSWKWMISGTPSAPQIGNCQMSGFSKEVLDFLLPECKEKLRRIPLFSKFTVKASGKGYPKIKSLRFEMKISSGRFTTAKASKILLLKSRLTEDEGGTELKSILLDCTEDSRNRSYGYSGVIRYYNRTSQTVELNAALEPQKDFIFDHWQIIHFDLPEGEREEILTDIRVNVKWRGDQMEAVCRWRRGEQERDESSEALRKLQEVFDLQADKLNLQRV